MIKKEKATVYKGHSRRFFTLNAAINDCAKHIILSEFCDCDPGDGHVTPPYTCVFHRHEHSAERYADLREIIGNELLNRYRSNIDAELSSESLQVLIKLWKDRYPWLEDLIY